MFDLAQREAWIDQAPQRVWVLKIHGTLLRADLPLSRIITSIRDPRDVLVSFRRFMNTSFEHALTVSEGVMKYPEAYRDHPPELLLRVEYAAIENHPDRVIRQVATFLEVPLAAEDEARILDSLSRDRVKRRIDETTQSVLGRVDAHEPVAHDELIVRDQTVTRAYDVATGFQTGHVSENKSGDWRVLLSEEEKRVVRERFGHWFERHGFAVD